MGMNVYRNKAGKIIVEVPVIYSEFKRIPTEFDSIEEASEMLQDYDFVVNLPFGEEGKYSEGVLEVDSDLLISEIVQFEEEEEEE